MSRIPLLPRWVLPSTSGIYDLESATISEMVPKLYGTMRELVNNYNEFAEEVNEELQNFTGSTSEEIENFKKSIEQRLICKFNDINAELAKMQLKMKQYTDTTLSRAFDVFGVTVKATGEDLILTDATDEKIRGLSIYGKTTQPWEPVPEYPAQLQSVGDAGSVTVTITNGTDEQQLTIATPDWLPGIPVSEGGNYTDATGQQWICDEIDLKRGVYIKRVNVAYVTSTDNGKPIVNTIRFSSKLPIPSNGLKNSMCSHLPYINNSYGLDEPHFYVHDGFAWIFLPVACGENPAEVTEWLSNNPMEIIYQLAEPVERPLTAAELAAYKQLHTYHMKDTTVTTDTGAGILLEYVAITQRYLENRMHDIAVETTREMVNAAIANGEIVVGLEYNEETEEANIIVGGAE